MNIEVKIVDNCKMKYDSVEAMVELPYVLTGYGSTTIEAKLELRDLVHDMILDLSRIRAELLKEKQ